MDWTVSTTVIDGVTLVTAIIDNPHDEPARFRLENDLDGPVWPPRRRGYPESGWDESGFEGVLGSGERLSLGYAVPAAPADPAARIAWTEPAVPTDGAGTPQEPSGRTGTETASTVRSFNDPRPPRSVLAPPGTGSAGTDSAGEWP